MKKLALVLSVTLLSACSNTNPNSASEFMREQQEKQAYLQQADAEHARQASKNTPALLLTIIQEHLNQGRYFAAHAYVKSYIQQFGDDPTIAIHHANTLRAIGESAQAQAIYNQALTGPRKAEALHGLGLLAAKNHHYTQAIDYMQQAAELNPTHATLLSDLGFAYLSTQQLTLARLPLGQAIELDPQNPKVVANVALLLLIVHKNTQAAQLMAEARMSPQAQSDIERLAEQLRYRAAPRPITSDLIEAPSSTPVPLSPTIDTAIQLESKTSDAEENSMTPQSSLQIHEWAEVSIPEPSDTAIDEEIDTFINPSPATEVISAPITRQIPLKKASH